MAGIDNVEDKSREGSEIILSLLRVLLERTSKQKLQWLSKSVNMYHSEGFEPVEFESLGHDELWDSSSYIKPKVAHYVVLGNGFYLFVGSGLLEHVEDDFDQVDDVNDQLDLLQRFIGCWNTCPVCLSLLGCILFPGSRIYGRSLWRLFLLGRLSMPK